MKISTQLLNRAEGKCELCTDSTDELHVYTVPPKTGKDDEDNIALCERCVNQIQQNIIEDPSNWRFITESIWSPIPAVQVTSYRLLKKLQDHSWAQDALSSSYLDDSTQEWADSTSGTPLVHKDSNGHVLQNGDNVTIIQDLNVKGASLVAKRGTAVRRIRLVPDNEEHIEGKVDGQQIVILTKYVKKN